MRLSSRLALVLALPVALGSIAGLAAQAPVPAAGTRAAVRSRTASAPAAPLKAITHDVYDSWNAIQGVRLSDDGQWLAYTLQPQDGDGHLVVKNLATGAELRQPRGRDAQLAAGGRYVVFVVAPVKAEVDKAKKAKKKPEDQPKAGLGVLDLDSGEAWTTERVKSVRLAKNDGRFIAYLREAPEKKTGEKKDEEKKAGEDEKPEGAKKKKEKKKDPGTDLVIRELATGAEVTVAEVTDYRWTDDGQWLAYATSSKVPAGDGAFARRMADGAVTALAAGQGHYKQLAWDEAGRQLAFVTDRDDYQAEAPAFALYYWTTGAGPARALVTTTTAGIGDRHAVSEHGALEFSKDGQRLFLGTAPRPVAERDEDAPEPVKVDLWHWKDPLLQPMQKVRAEEEKKRSYRAVVHLKDGRLVQLATPEIPDLTLTPDGDAALLQSPVPYQPLVSWDGQYRDVYAVDLATGQARRRVEKNRFEASISPGGRWILYYSDRDRAWFAVPAVGDGAPRNLTGALGVSFEDETWDTPEPSRPYGVAGWTGGDASVLLYDRYDVWEVTPDGTAAPRMVTAGQGRQARRAYRYVRLDPDQRVIAGDEPLLLSVVDDQTKASGYARLARLREPGAPQPLLLADRMVGGLVKAKQAARVVFTQQRADEFPDLWMSDLSFAAPRRLSDANPQQREYRWPTSELISFVNADGRPLRAILTRPNDFDPSKKYPLMVYIYEELTNGLHRYVAPSPGTSINITRYVSNGYVVLQPDIVYDTGYPGESAYKCVLPAVQKVVDMGFIDPARIGIQGHSWGGYQITYLITRTDMFRAVEAGASVSNMTSAYGGIRWGTGMSRAFQYEKTQSRIGGPPWQNPLQFIENSPIFWVEKIKTPYLTIHNDEDDAVPWEQGIEFFSAMRRLGKEIYFFNYNGEKHGLRDRENQKHWTVHMAEFFDHYLLGAPRPAWMDTPVPYLERGTRDVSGFFRKPETSPDR